MTWRNLRYWRPWDWWFHRRDRRGSIATIVIPAEHNVDMERVPVCLACGRDVEWDDATQTWKHEEGTTEPAVYIGRAARTRRFTPRSRIGSGEANTD